SLLMAIWPFRVFDALAALYSSTRIPTTPIRAAFLRRGIPKPLGVFPAVGERCARARCLARETPALTAANAEDSPKCKQKFTSMLQCKRDSGESHCGRTK